MKQSRIVSCIRREQALSHKNKISQKNPNIFFEAMNRQLNDEKHILRNAVLQIIVATICFIMLVRIFPMEAVSHHYFSKQKAIKKYSVDMESGKGDLFTVNDKKLQTVYFTHDFLKSITLYADCEIDNEYISEDAKEAMQWDPNINTDVNDEQTCTFRLYDDRFSCIYSEEINCKEVSNKGKMTAECNIFVEKGKPYYYELLASESLAITMFLPVADTKALEQEENSILYIDGIINEDTSLVADFEYTKKLNVVEQIVLYAFVIILSLIVYAVLCMIVNYLDNTIGDRYADIIRYSKLILCAAVLLAGIIAVIYAVIMNKLGGGAADRIVYFIGIVVLVFILETGLLKTKGIRIYRNDNLSFEQIWENYIQTLCFGFILYALCHYVNATEEYHHQTNIRWVLILLPLAILMNIGLKKICNRFNLICLVLFLTGLFIYSNISTADTKDFVLGQLNYSVFCAWLVLIVNIFKTKYFEVRLQNAKVFRSSSLKNKRTNVKASYMKGYGRYVYAILCVIFSLFMYIYRFEKVWVFTATLPFFAIFFTKMKDEDRTKLLRAFTNGVILSFFLFVLYCFKYRPYNKWLLYRYGGMFHTVACTGMYLAIVMGVVLAKLFGRYEKPSKKKRKYSITGYFFRNYKEIVLIGIVMGFVILTMSRTAFLTIFLTGFCVAVASAMIFKKNIAKVLREICILGVSVILCFPLTYSAVRIVPAFVNEPAYYEVEDFAQGNLVIEGTPVDSTRYMNIDRFFSILFGRFSNDQASNRKTDNDIFACNETYVVYGKKEIPAGVLYAAEDNVVSSQDDLQFAEEEQEQFFDISNGRFAIFSECIRQSGFSGHKGISITDSKGNEFAHAHNSYLQVAYNFGIIAGMIFVAIYMFSIVYSLKLFNKNGKNNDFCLVPFAVIAAFGLISFTEWAFHPGIPAGFCFLLMQPLIIKG